MIACARACTHEDFTHPLSRRRRSYALSHGSSRVGSRVEVDAPGANDPIESKIDVAFATKTANGTRVQMWATNKEKVWEGRDVLYCSRYGGASIPDMRRWARVWIAIAMSVARARVIRPSRRQ